MKFYNSGVFVCMMLCYRNGQSMVVHQPYDPDLPISCVFESSSSSPAPIPKGRHTQQFIQSHLVDPDVMADHMDTMQDMHRGNRGFMHAPNSPRPPISANSFFSPTVLTEVLTKALTNALSKAKATVNIGSASVKQMPSTTTTVIAPALLTEASTSASGNPIAQSTATPQEASASQQLPYNNFLSGMFGSMNHPTAWEFFGLVKRQAPAMYPGHFSHASCKCVHNGDIDGNVIRAFQRGQGGAHLENNINPHGQCPYGRSCLCPNLMRGR